MDAADPRVRLRVVERIGPGVEDVHGARFDSGAADERAGARPDPHLAFDTLVFGKQRSAGRPAIFAADIPVQHRLVGAAQPDRRRDHGLQHRLRLNTAPLMTFKTSLIAVWYSSDCSKSRVRSRNSPNSRAFSIAMTACAAKF